MSDLHRLYALLGALSQQAECKTCRKCEENVGLVYLLATEPADLERQGKQIVRTGLGANYVPRRADGWCSCFDPERNLCRIYDSRPLCCRLYPLDLIAIDGVPWWVLHSECPIAQRFQAERRLDVLVALTVALERALSEEELGEWLTQDRLSQAVEAFESEPTKVVPLRKVGAQLRFP